MMGLPCPSVHRMMKETTMRLRRAKSQRMKMKSGENPDQCPGSCLFPPPNPEVLLQTGTCQADRSRETITQVHNVGTKLYIAAMWLIIFMLLKCIKSLIKILLYS